jgi:hypothetical protein
MDGNSKRSRRTVLRSIGTFGAVLSSVAAGTGIGLAKESSGDSFTTLRAKSGSIPFESIQQARQEKLHKRTTTLATDAHDRSTIFARPETHRDRIVAYNLGFIGGHPVEYFGYLPRRAHTQQSRNEILASIHASADEHVAENQDVTTMSTNGFSDWERHYQVKEELPDKDGNLYLESEVHRRGENKNTDAYTVVSYGEMGGGNLSGVDQFIRNIELKLEQDWQSNADMEFDSRYPNTNVTGQRTDSWSVSVSLPYGLTATAGESYTQPDVQTYDESNPWNNLGKWRVDIDSSHTKKHTAHINPGSSAVVERDECIDPPGLNPAQPVTMVSLDAQFKKKSYPVDIYYSKAMSTAIVDDPSMC